MLSYFVSDLTARCAIDFQPLNLYIVIPLALFYQKLLLVSFSCFTIPTTLILPQRSELPRDSEEPAEQRAQDVDVAEDCDDSKQLVMEGHEDSKDERVQE